MANRRRRRYGRLAIRCGVLPGTGIHISQDPEHFDQKPRDPGRFAAGFQSKAGEPTKLTVSVVTPRQ